MTGQDEKSAQENGPGGGAAEQPAASCPTAPSRKPALALAIAAYLLIVGGIIAGTFGMYMWDGHEGLFPVYRTARMVEAWRAGDGLSARWMAPTVYGYGWPFFMFYAPGGYMVAGAAHLGLGISLGAATKLSFLLSLTLGGLCVFGLACSLARQGGARWPEQWGLACATLFTLAPYHFSDVFVRTSLAESWAWCAMAGAMWALETSRRRPLAGIAGLALGVAALTLCHNISALYGSIIIGVYTLATAPWGRGGWKWTATVAAAGALGVGMAAWFWLPALAMLKSVRAGDADWFWGAPASLKGQALYWPQFFMEQLGRGASRPAMDDTLSLTPGVLTVSGGCAAAIALLCRAVAPPQRRPVAVALGFCACLMFAMCHWMPWAWAPAMLRYIQFPWRLEVFLVLMLTLALAGAGGAVEHRIRPWWITLASVAAGYWMFYGVLISPFAEAADGSKEAGAPVADDAQMEAWYQGREARGPDFAGSIMAEYKPVGASDDFIDPAWQAAHPAPAHRLEALSGAPHGQFEVADFRRIGAQYHWRTTAPAEIDIQAALFAFSGWRLAIDGKAAPERLSATGRGLVQLRLPGGAHEVDLRYDRPPSAAAGEAISAAAAAALAGWLGVGFVLARKRRARRDPAPSPA